MLQWRKSYRELTLIWRMAWLPYRYSTSMTDIETIRQYPEQHIILNKIAIYPGIHENGVLPWEFMSFHWQNKLYYIWKIERNNVMSAKGDSGQRCSLLSSFREHWVIFLIATPTLASSDHIYVKVFMVFMCTSYSLSDYQASIYPHLYSSMI